MKGWDLLARNLTVVFGSWPSPGEQMCKDFNGNRWDICGEGAGAHRHVNVPKCDSSTGVITGLLSSCPEVGLQG